MCVISEIRAERQRQMDVEGWTPESDNRHDSDELARDLIRAAALIVAEIEGLHRRAAGPSEPSH